MLNEMCLISHIFHNMVCNEIIYLICLFSFPVCYGFHLFTCVLTDILYGSLRVNVPSWKLLLENFTLWKHSIVPIEYIWVLQFLCLQWQAEI